KTTFLFTGITVIFVPLHSLSDRTKGSSRWIFVEELKNWSDAQSHCRQSYTDLASVRNLTENEEIRGLISYISWIGLFRDAWKWSDGSTMSFSKWDDNQPSGGDERCVASHLGKWRTDLLACEYHISIPQDRYAHP
uniref:C-type lectin domain-containing protein n=1 Tax=Myripristis murdjan TaxID=586833 RepID=A0A667WJH7_9TELE